MGDAIMNVARPLGTAEIEQSLEVELAGNIQELARGSGTVFRQAETGDGELSTENLAALLRRVAESSTREVDSLIADLQALRRKLSNDGNRIQREITDYTELSQQVMQLTNIISESVKKLPAAPSIGR
jgi:dsDNA-specific endonuclease/ATPase MutS2